MSGVAPPSSRGASTFPKLEKDLPQAEGAPEQLVSIQETEVLGNHLDVTVAGRDLSPGPLL